MATIVPTFERNGDFSVVTYHWVGLADGDDGAPVQVPTYADKTVQAVGDFDTTTVLSIEGSCIAAPASDADWDQMDDPQGTALQFSARAIKAISENPVWIRPHIVSGGTENTDVDVHLTVRRQTDLRT